MLQVADLDGDGMMDFVAHSTVDNTVSAIYTVIVDTEDSSRPTRAPSTPRPTRLPSTTRPTRRPTTIEPTASPTDDSESQQCKPFYERCTSADLCCNPARHECNGVCRKKPIPNISAGAKKIFRNGDRVRGSTRRELWEYQNIGNIRETIDENDQKKTFGIHQLG